ncbi:hypothetical protein FPV67DRAFT_1777905 [Lyophyllum atratum]|nr:hypothetical protein FPV67DRAFT_1777905 [Lyophyllum atratum]
MVALTPRFAVLGAFVYLASFSLVPLSVSAAAIHKPSLKENRDLPIPLPFGGSESSADDNSEGNQNEARSATWSPLSMLRLAQLKAKKRHHDHHDDHDWNLVDIDLEILKRRQDQHHFHARRARNAIPHKSGASHHVSPSSKREERVLGEVDIMSADSESPSGKKIACLYMVPSTNGSYILNASENNCTQMYLVDGPSTSRADSVMLTNADSDSLVTLQAPMPDSEEDFCTTYNLEDSSPEPLTMEKCVFPQPNEQTQSGKSQMFAYNKDKGSLRPFYVKDAPGHADSDGSAQSVLERDDATTPRNVTLVFVPEAPHAVNVKDTTVSPDTSAVTSTSTTTTTVTVTGAATASPSVAAVDVTSSAETSPSSSVPALTSTADPSTPTAASAGALDVQVVGPPSSSTDMFTSTSESAAAPTTTINAQDVAASIAASSSAPALATDTTSAVTTIASSSSMAAPSAAAAADSTSTSSGADATMTPFTTAPYQWMFKRE